MSVAAAALAAPREFAALGRTYAVHPIDYDGLARFALWLEDRARGAADRSDRADAHAGVTRDAAAGRYEPGGDVFEAAVRAPHGARKMLALMLVAPAGEPDPAAWREEAAWDLFADEAALAAAGEAMRAANDDPLAVAARRRPARRAARSH